MLSLFDRYRGRRSYLFYAKLLRRPVVFVRHQSNIMSGRVVERKNDGRAPAQAPKTVTFGGTLDKSAGKRNINALFLGEDGKSTHWEPVEQQPPESSMMSFTAMPYILDPRFRTKGSVLRLNGGTASLYVVQSARLPPGDKSPIIVLWVGKHDIVQQQIKCELTIETLSVEHTYPITKATAMCHISDRDAVIDSIVTTTGTYLDIPLPLSIAATIRFR